MGLHLSQKSSFLVMSFPYFALEVFFSVSGEVTGDACGFGYQDGVFSLPRSERLSSTRIQRPHLFITHVWGSNAAIMPSPSQFSCAHIARGASAR